MVVSMSASTLRRSRGRDETLLPSSVVETNCQDGDALLRGAILDCAIDCARKRVGYATDEQAERERAAVGAAQTAGVDVVLVVERALPR
jgi:hypothetical protein